MSAEYRDLVSLASKIFGKAQRPAVSDLRERSKEIGYDDDPQWFLSEIRHGHTYRCFAACSPAPSSRRLGPVLSKTPETTGRWAGNSLRRLQQPASWSEPHPTAS
jgi:hypothetical protein